MSKGMRDMVAINKAIDDIINAPYEEFTEEEAQKVLIESGVMTKKNTIKKVYKEILVKADNTNEEDFED